MNNILLILISLSMFNVSAKQTPINVYILCDDYEMTKSKLKQLADDVFLKNKDFKNLNLSVHHSVTINEVSRPWHEGKKQVSYFLNKMDCDFSSCENLINYVEEMKTDLSTLYIGEGMSTCSIQDLRIKMVPIMINSNSIIESIKEQQDRHKKSDKEVTLIFYIPPKKDVSKPKISFSDAKIELFEGDQITLSPNVNGEFDYNWSPSTDLSCSSCPNPILTAINSEVINVEITSQLGCTATSKIDIVVKKRCPGITAPTIQFSIDDGLYQQVLSDKSKWLIASDQPGSKTYYLICKPNCGESFRIELIDNENSVVWPKPGQEFSYLLQDVASGHMLHVDYPNYFIFKVDLENVGDLSKYDYYNFKIYSYDLENNSYPVYRSGGVKFVDCAL